MKQRTRFIASSLSVFLIASVLLFGCSESLTDFEETEVDDALIAELSSTLLKTTGNGAPKLYLVQRHATTAFGESYAFPGGVVDPVDRNVHDRCRGISAATANAALKLREHALDFYSAAVRELFEETGVLLAHEPGGAWAFTGQPALRAQLRAALLTGDCSWDKLLQAHDLQLACDTLHYIGHWETPIQRPKRFSTRFFVAAMPAGQQAQHAPGELTDGRWLSAAEALALSHDKVLHMPFPTLKNLQFITGFKSLDDLLHWAAARAASGIERIRPELIEIDGQLQPVLPGDPGYPSGDS